MRPLGQFERALIETSQTYAFNIVTLARLPKSIDLNRLEDSINAITDISPALSASVDNSGKNFIHCNRTWPVNQFKQTDIKQLIETELAFQFKPGEQLWRAFISPGESENYLLITMHHVLSDGTSKLAFIHNLLNHCAGMPAQTHALAPALDSLKTGNTKWRKIAAAMFKQEMQYRKFKSKQSLAKQPPQPTHILSRKIDSVTTQNVQKQLTKNRITLNSFLQTALATAMREQIFTEDKVALRGFSFASLRNKCKPSVQHTDMSPIIAMLPYTLIFDSQTSLLDQCRSFQHHNQQLNRAGGSFGLAMISRWVNKMVSSGKYRMGEVALSFSGKIDSTSEHLLGLDSYISSNPKSPPLSAWGQIQPNGEMRFSFCYHSIREEQAKSVCDRFQLIIEEFAEC